MNKMNRMIMVLLLLCGSSAALLAQVPGYLGKKLSLQGEFHSFPALGGPTAANRGFQNLYGDAEGRFGLNWSGALKVGYANSRYTQLMFSAEYMKTGMTQYAYTPTTDIFGEKYYDEHYLFFNLTGITAGIGYRKFASEKGGLAPMGKYKGWSLLARYMKGEILDKNTTYATGSLTHAPIGIKANVITPILSYETGTNIIIKDRFLFNVGLKINLPIDPRVYRYAFGDTLPWDHYYDTETEYQDGNTTNFRTLAAYRQSVHSVLMVYIGVGLMP